MNGLKIIDVQTKFRRNKLYVGLYYTRSATGVHMLMIDITCQVTVNKIWRFTVTNISTKIQ